MGKVTVITGGTSGIGRGIAEKILAESAAEDRVFVTYGHNEDKAQAFLENLPLEKRSQVILMKADMSSYEDMMDFVAELKDQADHIDWLVSNAGSVPMPSMRLHFEEWTGIVNTNLSVPVFMVKELRSMMSRGWKHFLYRILCRTAGVFVFPCVWCYQGGNPFSGKISGERV